MMQLLADTHTHTPKTAQQRYMNNLINMQRTVFTSHGPTLLPHNTTAPQHHTSRSTFRCRSIMQNRVDTRCWSAATTALLFLGIKVQSKIITVGPNGKIQVRYYTKHYSVYCCM